MANMYNPSSADIYNFFENLARFFGTPNANAKVKEQWAMPKGNTRTFTSMTAEDIERQASREGAPEVYDSDKNLRHWRKLPFRFSTAYNDSGDSREHSGYFIVPAYSDSPNEGYDVASVVLEDGTKLDYDRAKEFFNILNSDNRIKNFSIADNTESMVGTEYAPKEVTQELYSSIMRPHWESQVAQANQAGDGSEIAEVTYRDTGTSEPKNKTFFDTLGEFFGNLFK